MNKFIKFVPVAMVISRVFRIPESEIPAWLVAALGMDEVQHQSAQRWLRDWFRMGQVTVPVEAASRDFGINLQEVRISEDWCVAAQKILLHHTCQSLIVNQQVWDAHMEVLFPRPNRRAEVPPETKKIVPKSDPVPQPKTVVVPAIETVVATKSEVPQEIKKSEPRVWQPEKPTTVKLEDFLVIAAKKPEKASPPVLMDAGAKARNLQRLILDKAKKGEPLFEKPTYASKDNRSADYGAAKPSNKPSKPKKKDSGEGKQDRKPSNKERSRAA